MQHLMPETLARLADETPTREEQAHLESCAQCRAELEAYREQAAALAALPPLHAPDRGWPLLEARLAQEGLLRTPAPTARGWGSPRLLRAAVYAGLFLMGSASGVLVGRATGGPADARLAATGEPATLSVPAVSDSDEAARLLRDAEDAYLAALSQYQDLRGLQRGDDPAARLAALEGIVLTTRAALEAAPADPVINGYYLTAVGQRDAVLRQIAGTSSDPWF
jgi:hypothetical protein